ncbi:TNF receptor-associated factor 5-like [Rhipicephalus sanguineus]|nr:TNF receptor-associated factor 5-like [Rhipicephalus sanguineus]
MTFSEEISSGTMYINTPGYHVEFTVGFGRNSIVSSPHLSFNCQICPGQYDHMLSWPFKNKIIVVLVNQLEEQAQRYFEMHAASAEHAVECLKRPESEQRNPKFGVSQIISVPLLENVKKGFLSQNCVVFKIIVPPI